MAKIAAGFTVELFSYLLGYENRWREMSGIPVKAARRYGTALYEDPQEIKSGLLLLTYEKFCHGVRLGQSAYLSVGLSDPIIYGEPPELY